jgi:hypothetical protein
MRENTVAMERIGLSNAIDAKEIWGSAGRSRIRVISKG